MTGFSQSNSYDYMVCISKSGINWMEIRKSFNGRRITIHNLGTRARSPTRRWRRRYRAC
ncbi:unnamed protein product [Periconia digitata]|uniref:Uncharacterized protein n=1 Tax=Periconia digitata TaxID=1303443 RepID=A0A9W4UM31_9PLEO|nr:unnamed protein product [Periconia digitata]